METTEDFLGLGTAVLVLISIISMWALFRKANLPGWASIIPIFNIYYFLKMIRRSPLWMVLFALPAVFPLFIKRGDSNAAVGFVAIMILIMSISFIFSLAKAFGKGIPFSLGLLLFGFIFLPILAFGSSEYVYNQKQDTTRDDIVREQVNESQPVESKPHVKPPEIISGLIQPGLIAKVFTIFFMGEGMVLVKTGSGSTDASGSMRAFHGGGGATANVMAGIGKLWDMQSAQKRGNYLEAVGGYSTDALVSADKANFLIPNDAVSRIDMKGPGWGGELKIKISTMGKEHKFRIDTRSDYLANSYFKSFAARYPGKVFKA
jgi:hypothetical protein